MAARLEAQQAPQVAPAWPIFHLVNSLFSWNTRALPHGVCLRSVVGNPRSVDDFALSLWLERVH